jgi:hypothetical protein
VFLDRTGTVDTLAGLSTLDVVLRELTAEDLDAPVLL